MHCLFLNAIYFSFNNIAGANESSSDCDKWLSETDFCLVRVLEFFLSWILNSWLPLCFLESNSFVLFSNFLLSRVI